MEKNSGFTLLETMIVVAIISILTGITVPNMGKWMANYRLKGVARELVSDMQWTKMAAIKENRDWAITFNPSGTYTIQSSGNDGRIDTVSDNPPPEKTADFSDAKSGVGFGKGPATIDATVDADSFPSDFDGISYTGDRVFFNSKGMVNKLGYVYLSNDIGTVYAVGTNTMVGSIVIKKWTGTAWE